MRSKDALASVPQADPKKPENPPKRRTTELRKRSGRLAAEGRKAAREGDYSRAAHEAWRAAEALIISRAVQASHDPESEALLVNGAHRLIHVLRRRNLERWHHTGWFWIYGRYIPHRPEAQPSRPVSTEDRP